MAETILVVPAHSDYIAQGCPVCHRGIEEGQTIALCSRCRSPHHEECWYKNGGCGKLGCRGVASAKRDALGRVEAKSGFGPDEIKPVTDPSTSQLPLPVLIGIGVAVVLIVYFAFIR